MLASRKSATIALFAIAAIGLIAWLAFHMSSPLSTVPREAAAFDRGESPTSSSSTTIQTAGDARPTSAAESENKRRRVPERSDERAPVAIDTGCKLTIQLSPPPEAECRATALLSYPGTRGTREFFRIDSDGGSRMQDWKDVPSTGLFEWGTLPPNVPIHLEVSSLGARLATAEFVPLAPGEHRSSELSLTMKPESVTVGVRARSGRKVPRAYLRFVVVEGQGERQEQTDENGFARLKLYLPVALDLATAADGYASTVLHRVDLSSGKLLVVLDDERVVHVELVDEQGRAFEDHASVDWCSDSALGAIGGKETSPGRWRLVGLPTGEIVIQAKAGELGWTSILHDTANSKVKLVVRRGTRVSLKFTVDAAMEYDAWALRATSVTDPTYSTREFEGRNEGLVKYVRFGSLPPGTYRLQVEHLDTSATNSWEPWRGVSTVEVGAKNLFLTLEN